MNKPDLKVKGPREYLDPMDSHRGGLGGFFETVLRRFKNLVHLSLIVPIYGLGCLLIGVSAVPGIALFEFLMKIGPDSPWLRYFKIGFSLAAAFFAFGFTLLFVCPLGNWIARANLKPWRGPYYSLEAIRWYIHNGFTYLVRFLFLEFVTPTPFNLLFYRMMGMKIGKGTAINSTWISDPSLIELGDKVTIGGSVTMVAHYGQGGFLVLAPVKVGNNVTIGLKAIVMGGVTIGDNVRILPHAVVMPKTTIPSGETWSGVPARKVEQEN